MPTKKYYSIKMFVVLAWVCVSQCFVLQSASAQDRGLLLTPTRVIFEGKTRSTVVKMVNPNDEPYTYEIKIVSTRMNEYGNLAEVESPTEKEIHSQKMIRFSPRRATIAPKGWQTVRIMVRKPKDLAPGEYRSQLKVSPILTRKFPGETEEEPVGVSVSIDLVYAVSIPIIVRHGGPSDVDLVIKLPQVITKNERYYLETLIERYGSYSSFFDVTAYLVSSSTSRKKISENRGVAVYTEKTTRYVHLPLTGTDSLTGKRVEIELTDRESKEGKILGSKTFQF